MPHDADSNALSDTPSTPATLPVNGFIPTTQQLRYLAAAADISNHNLDAIAKAARVNRATAWKWRQKPDFVQWFQEQVMRAFGMKYALALDRTADLAIQGSPEHMKLLMLKMGDLRHGNDDGHGNAGQQISVHINVPRPELAPGAARRALDTIDVTPRPALQAPTSEHEH